MALENRTGLNIKDLVGGPGGVRTLDLMTASHARSQLRHRPKRSMINFYHGCMGLSIEEKA